MLAAGFTIVASPHSVAFYPYAQQLETALRLLSAAQDDLYMVLMIGRIHYREEPLQRVRTRVAPPIWVQCRNNDAALAGACYRVDGIEGLCRLEGEFVLACYDRSAKLLVTLRDPMGHYPLFWVPQKATIALSTSIRPLADFVSDLELDMEYTADYLACPYELGGELPRQHTAYRGVTRLLPGWRCEVNLSTLQVACQPYWQWRDKVVPVAVSSVQEAGALVRERLDAAVRERLSRHTHTASHFSGGFDSTGIALLASRLSETPVHALSLVYESRPRLAGETEYIEAALQSSTAILSHPIIADDLLDYDAYERLPVLDEPSVFGAHWNAFAVLARAAAEVGADVLMTGDGADALFFHAPWSFVSQLISAGKVSQAWRLANGYSYRYGMSTRRIMTEALRQLLPYLLRDGIGALARGGRTRFEHTTERTIPVWFAEDFIRRYSLRQRIAALQLPLSRSGFLTAEALAFSVGDWLTWYAAMPYGVTMPRPYYDPRVLALGLALPKWLHAQPAGPMKPVLAAALRDVLPEKILTRSRKLHFGIFADGMTRKQDALKAMIQAAPVSEGILRRPVLLDTLAKASLGMYENQWGVGRLRIALSYLLWLSSREAWRNLSVPTLALQQLCRDAASTQ